MNPAVRENGVRYWLALTWHTLRFLVRQRRWSALARALWWTLIRGYYLELCQSCARPYVLWYAPEALWAAVMFTHPEGLICPSCFDRRATALGLTLQWVPHLFPINRDALNESMEVVQ